MDIRPHLVRGVMVIQLKGNFVGREGVKELRTLVESNISLGHKRIVLNLLQVENIDAVGVTELLVNNMTIMSGDGQLALCATGQVKKTIVAFTRLLPILEDEAMAIANLRAN